MLEKFLIADMLTAIFLFLCSLVAPIILNSAHNTMLRRCCAFQFFMPPQAGWRMLRATSKTASEARDLRVKRKIFPDVCISCSVVFVLELWPQAIT